MSAELLNDTIENNFRHHPPNQAEISNYETIRKKARRLAYLFDDLCPQSREKSLAMTKLEEAVMWANAAIARNRKIDP